MRLSNADIAAIINREISRARGYDSDTLSAVRARALDLYHGRLPLASGVEGRSSVVSLDVADALRATLAQIAPVVRTSQIEFEALSQDDEQQAQTESDFVRVRIEQSGGYEIVDSASFDALLIGNGWLHPYVDERTDVTEMRFPGKLSPEETYAITQMAPPDTKITLREGAEVTIARVAKTTKTLKIEAVPAEEMLFSEEGASCDVSELRFVARRQLFTASQLLERGIPAAKIDLLPDANFDDTGERARQGQLANDGGEQSVQQANRLKVVYRCYVRLSIGDNNTTELRHIWIGENQTDMLLNEPADFTPFITGSAIPVPHRITGTGFGEVLESVQNAKTHVIRQYLDNLTVMNSSRIGAVEGQVNMADLTNGRINGVVRMRSPDAIVPLPAADIGPQAIAGLGYLDQVRTQRVGSSLDFTEVQAQLMGTSATAAAGQLSKVELMGGWFASNIVRTMLLPLFTMVHRILRTDLAGPAMARIGGKWAETDTGTWQERQVTDIQMGMTTTEKAERIMALTQTIQQMQQMIATGGSGIIVDLPRLYNAMGDWVRTAGLGSPDQYFIDPKSPESQQASQQAMRNQKQQSEDQVRMQAELIKLQHDFELEKQRRDLEYKHWSDKLDAEVEEAKLVGNGVIEMKKINWNAENVRRGDE
jgi:hypothetical protein